MYTRDHVEDIASPASELISSGIAVVVRICDFVNRLSVFFVQ